MQLHHQILRLIRSIMPNFWLIKASFYLLCICAQFLLLIYLRGILFKITRYPKQFLFLFTREDYHWYHLRIVLWNLGTFTGLREARFHLLTISTNPLKSRSASQVRFWLGRSLHLHRQERHCQGSPWRMDWQIIRVLLIQSMDFCFRSRTSGKFFHHGWRNQRPGPTLPPLMRVRQK